MYSPEYCDGCGQKLIARLLSTRKFDDANGKLVYRKQLKCPSWSLLNFWKHTKALVVNGCGTATWKVMFYQDGTIRSGS